MNQSTIIANIKAIRADLPADVKLEAAAKTRSAEEAMAAIEGGIDALGYNYVQEGIAIKAELEKQYGSSFAEKAVPFHLIGHLQSNKINKALQCYSMIETVDSLSKAQAINKRTDSVLDILIQVNVGKEETKSGAAGTGLKDLAQSIDALDHIQLRGLMTIEPYTGDKGEMKAWFQAMKALFDQIKPHMNAAFDTLSMGMSHSYKLAAQEGATMVRIGTGIFGPRT